MNSRVLRGVSARTIEIFVPNRKRRENSVVFYYFQDPRRLKTRFDYCLDSTKQRRIIFLPVTVSRHTATTTTNKRIKSKKEIKGLPLSIPGTSYDIYVEKRFYDESMTYVHLYTVRRKRRSYTHTRRTSTLYYSHSCVDDDRFSGPAFDLYRCIRTSEIFNQNIRSRVIYGVLCALFCGEGYYLFFFFFWFYYYL